MVYYRTQWDFLKDFPMSIIKELFLENPNDIAMRNKYIEAMEKYRNEYQRIINLGITKEELEKAGVPAPPPPIISAGPGKGIPGLPIIPILTTTTNLPPPTREEISQIELRIERLEDAEERLITTVPQPPVTPNRPTRPQDPNAPQRPPARSRLDEILEKYGENAGDISNEDWGEVQRILATELEEFQENPDIDLSNVDTSLEDELEEEFERIMTTRQGQNKGLNNSVTLQILERLLTITERASLRLKVPTLQELKDYPAFRLNNDQTRNKNQKTKMKKKKNQTIENTILRRIWTNNKELWQDIIDIIQRYGGLRIDQIQGLTTASDTVEIGNLVDSIYGRSGVNVERLNREIMERLKQEAINQGAPLWFTNIFDPTPMEVTVDNPPMASSIKDDTIHRILNRSMRQELLNLGIPELDAQEMSLRLIEHFQQQEHLNIVEAGDFTEGINRTITILLDEFNSVIKEAKRRLTGSFTVNKRKLIELMKAAFVTYIQEKDNKLTLLQKVQVFRDLISQVVDEVGRSSSSSSSSGGAFQSQPLGLTPMELAQEIKDDFDIDVLNGRGIRIQLENKEDPIEVEDLLPVPSIFDPVPNLSDDPDDDPDDSDDEDWENHIPDYRGPDSEWINRYRDPDPDPDPPDDPPIGNVVNFFIRGSWRSLSLRTLIKALIIAGATAGTIYSIVEALVKQGKYGEDEGDEGDKGDDDNEGDDDDDEENNQGDNIEDNMPVTVTPEKPFGTRPIDATGNVGLLRPGGVYIPVNDINEVMGKPDVETGGKDPLADLRKRYLELYQAYIDAQKRGAHKDELNSIYKQIMDVSEKIKELTGGGGEGGEETNGDDPDTTAIFDHIEHAEQSFEPDIVDPAEAELFLSTDKEAAEEETRWRQYSMVKPGFGLGTINQNGLAMHNYQEEKKRFTNCFKSEKPGRQPTKTAVEKKWPKDMQPFWLPAVMNEYGQVEFEDSFYNEKMNRAFTNPVPVDNRRRTWENSNSIYHPENSLATYKPRPVRIPENRHFAGYYGVNRPPSQNGGFVGNREVFDDMYKYGKLMPNDFNHKSRDLSYDLPKSGSARFT